MNENKTAPGSEKGFTFLHTEGNTTYVVNLFFRKTGTTTIDDRVKKMIREDTKSKSQVE